ncbi:ARHGB factor, partial [Pheucticus melanocephalus]|nr:ARHGB factor [Pheucticus melanocephalus]
GNFFYLSLPTGPPRPGGDTRDSPGDTRDSPGDVRDTSGDVRDTSGDIGDTPGDTSGDAELILGTLEELREKLLSLRAMEVAHRQLLRSLGGGDAIVPSSVPSTVPSVPSTVPSVPSSVPGRAPPPPSPQRSPQAPRGHEGRGGTATPAGTA